MKIKNSGGYRYFLYHSKNTNTFPFNDRYFTIICIVIKS